MNKERFKAIMEEIFPQVEAIRRIMKENQIQGLASMTFNAEDYATINFHAAPYYFGQGRYGMEITEYAETGSMTEELKDFKREKELSIQIPVARRDELIRLEERVDMLMEYVQEGIGPVNPETVAHYLNFKLRNKGEEK